jgi:GDPmannose 4,6-dehydratase
MTTAFITGITGMVGSHLADYLIANTDWEIHGLLRWRSPLAYKRGKFKKKN